MREELKYLFVIAEGKMCHGKFYNVPCYFLEGHRCEVVNDETVKCNGFIYVTKEVLNGLR